MLLLCSCGDKTTYHQLISYEHTAAVRVGDAHAYCLCTKKVECQPACATTSAGLDMNICDGIFNRGDNINPPPPFSSVCASFISTLEELEPQQHTHTPSMPAGAGSRFRFCCIVSVRVRFLPSFVLPPHVPSSFAFAGATTPLLAACVNVHHRVCLTRRGVIPSSQRVGRSGKKAEPLRTQDERARRVLWWYGRQHASRVVLTAVVQGGLLHRPTYGGCYIDLQGRL